MKIDKKLIKELVDHLSEFNLTELEYQEGQTKIKVSKASKGVEQIKSATIVSSNKTVLNDSENDGVRVKSPIIGTFYRKPSPEKSLFVEVGQQIKEGDVLCVIEAMKLFNEIESEISGKIVKVLVDDSSPVEFDQPLFLVDPS